MKWRWKKEAIGKNRVEILKSILSIIKWRFFIQFSHDFFSQILEFLFGTYSLYTILQYPIRPSRNFLRFRPGLVLLFLATCSFFIEKLFLASFCWIQPNEPTVQLPSCLPQRIAMAWLDLYTRQTKCRLAFSLKRPFETPTRYGKVG